MTDCFSFFDSRSGRKKRSTNERARRRTFQWLSNEKSTAERELRQRWIRFIIFDVSYQESGKRRRRSKSVNLDIINNLCLDLDGKFVKVLLEACLSFVVKVRMPINLMQLHGLRAREVSCLCIFQPFGRADGRTDANAS